LVLGVFAREELVQQSFIPAHARAGDDFALDGETHALDQALLHLPAQLLDDLRLFGGILPIDAFNVRQQDRASVRRDDVYDVPS
jgi:hypothetical protein